MSCVNLLGFVGIAHDVLPPAYFHMLAEITGRFCIASVRIITDHAAIPFPPAMGCRTLKHMYVVVIEIYNGSNMLEEGMER